MTIAVPKDFAAFLKVFHNYSNEHITELNSLLQTKDFNSIDYANFLRHSSYLVNSINDFSLYELPVQFYAFLAEYLRVKNVKSGLDAFEAGFCALLLHNMMETCNNGDVIKLATANTLLAIIATAKPELVSILNTNHLADEDYAPRLHCALHYVTRLSLQKPALKFLADKLNLEFMNLVVTANGHNSFSNNRYIVEFIFSNPLFVKQETSVIENIILLVAHDISALSVGASRRFFAQTLNILKEYPNGKFIDDVCKTLGTSLTPDMRIRFAALLQQMYDTKENNAPASAAAQSYTPVLREAVVFALYDHRLFFRDSEHFSLQCEKIQRFLQPHNYFLLDIGVYSAIFNLLWHGQLDGIDPELMRSLACKDFSDPNSKLTKGEIHAFGRLLSNISIFSHKTLQQSVIVPQRTRGFVPGKNIASFFIDALDEHAPWWKALWHHTSPVLRFAIKTNINTEQYLSAFYSDGEFVLFNPEAPFGNITFPNTPSGKKEFNLYLKETLFATPDNSDAPITGIVITQYQGYTRATVAPSVSHIRSISPQPVSAPKELVLPRSPSVPTQTVTGKEFLTALGLHQSAIEDFTLLPEGPEGAPFDGYQVQIDVIAPPNSQVTTPEKRELVKEPSITPTEKTCPLKFNKA